MLERMAMNRLSLWIDLGKRTKVIHRVLVRTKNGRYKIIHEHPKN